MKGFISHLYVFRKVLKNPLLDFEICQNSAVFVSLSSALTVVLVELFLVFHISSCLEDRLLVNLNGSLCVKT